MGTNTINNKSAADELESQGENLYSLQTNIDLAGNACPERLVIYEKKLIVYNSSFQIQREWRFERIEAFRVEPTVGSCFLQAQTDGHWVDILRQPGSANQQLIDMIARLNTYCGSDRYGEELAAKALPQNVVSPLRMSNNDAEAGHSQHFQTATRILALLRPFRGNVILLLALSLGVVAIEVIPPMLQRLLVDRVLQIGLPKNSQQQLLLFLLAIVAGLLMVRIAATLVTVWKGIVASRVGTTMTSNLRNELVEKLNQLPLAFHDRNQVGMLMSQVAYDTETLHTLVYHMTSGFIMQTLQLVGIGVMLIYLNAKLATITLLPMPLIIVGSWYFTRYLQPRHHHYWEAVGKQASALMGMLSGIRVVKLFVQEDREIARFSQSSRRLRDSRMSVDVSTAMFTALMGFIFAVGSLAVWYIGGRDVLFGTMTLGSLMAFLAYLAMFYTPLTSIAESTAWFANFFSISRRICDLLDIPNEVESPGAAGPDRIQGRVEFQDASFGYDKSRPVLKDISFTIMPGEMAGVTGRSGSGKSTLVSLIGRLYDADSGRILIDGADVRQMNPRQLRRRIGMVPQEPFLFRGTVAENIAYGDFQATAERIMSAARQAEAHDFIMQMPFAYETQLGEGGSGLSGGERQRLSIARALAFDPDILILDEATASVDAETERAICDSLRKQARRRTTIVIAHRLSTLQNSDRLLVFDNGRLIEQGTPRELFAQGGLYASLAKIQWNLKESRQRVGLATGIMASHNGNGNDFDQGEEDAIYHPFMGADAASYFTSDDNDGKDGNNEIEEMNNENNCTAWLDPSEAAIESDRQGALCIISGGRREVGVYALRAFPAIHERKFISLRRTGQSGRASEVGMIDTLERWPRDAQQAILQSLGRRYFLCRIREIRQMSTKGNLLEMTVLTDSGAAKFHLDKPGEGSQAFGRDGLLLVDAGGNYYIIPDRLALPKRQQRLLNLYFGD